MPGGECGPRLLSAQLEERVEPGGSWRRERQGRGALTPGTLHYTLQVALEREDKWWIEKLLFNKCHWYR